MTHTCTEIGKAPSLPDLPGRVESTWYRRSVVRFARGVFLLAALATGPRAARAADEDGLVELWKLHLATPEDHEAVIRAGQAFAAKNAKDPLLPVARGIQTWRTLSAGRREEAFSQWEADLSLPPSPLNDAARRLAFAWMSRRDQETVAAALQAYYRKEIAYPKDLAQLAANPKLKTVPRAPETDRFGKAWMYALTGFEKLKGFENQKYTLRSAVLGDLSDVKAAAALPYASRITAVPRQVVPMPDNTLAVRFNYGNVTSVTLLGSGSGDVLLAYVGAKIIVVCDYTHWKILPRP